MSRFIPVSRLISIGLGLVWALLCWNASGATVFVEYADPDLPDAGASIFLTGSGHTIEEAEADLHSKFEANARFGKPIKRGRELLRCTEGGYAAATGYNREPDGKSVGGFLVCGYPSWESAFAAVKAKCMRESANFYKAIPHHSQCMPDPTFNDRFRTKDRWFFSERNKEPEPPKPEPKPQVTIGTRSYDGRYAPDCTKIGLALDILGETMTLSENGRVLFTQKGKLHNDYWGRTPPPGGEAWFSGKHHGDPAFELMRQGGVLFGNINPSKQLEAAMAGRPLKGYRYCGLTCNAGKAEVSGGNLVCRR